MKKKFFSYNFLYILIFNSRIFELKNNEKMQTINFLSFDRSEKGCYKHQIPDYPSGKENKQ